MAAMPDNARRAFEQQCLNALARREHSRAELAARGGETPPDVVTDVLDALAAQGWQSNERFADAYVHSKAAQGNGALKIRQSLRSKGLSEQLVREALAAIDWPAVAATAYAKKYDGIPKTPAERAKRQRFMAQRGFTFDEINAVMKNHD